MILTAYLTKRQALINQALAKHLPPGGNSPRPIHEAMRYSVLGEGKRIRPILTLAACEAVGGNIKDVLPTACALEMIHAYSLVHDDLPSMDDDDFRRGKLSCHKKFGEAIGVLTGDALLTLSFQLLSKANHNSSSHLQVIQEISKAIGTQGMIGGQVADIEAAATAKVGAQAIRFINSRKTGALISASVRVGAILGSATPRRYQTLKTYGDRVGLTFQLVDDLLDRDGMVRVEGAAHVRKQAQILTAEAVAVLKPLGSRAEPLRALAQFILTRKS